MIDTTKIHVRYDIPIFEEFFYCHAYVAAWRGLSADMGLAVWLFIFFNRVCL